MNSNWIDDNIEFIDHILVNENALNAIYSDQEMTDAIGEVKEYNNKIANVIKHIEEDGIKKILIEHKDIIVGWIVFENSIPLLNKPEEKIEVEYEKFYSPSINKMINKNGDYNLYFQRYQVNSRFYIYHEEQLLEAIFRKNTFVAFAPSEVIDRYQEKQVQAHVVKAHIDLFVSSKMDEKIISNQLDVNTPVTIEGYFPMLKRAKIRQDLVVGWVNIDDLKLEESLPDSTHNTSESFIKQQHIDYIYINEQKKVKVIITKLLNESIALEKKINRQRELNRKITKRYENLCNSKLGKLQLLIWQKRAKRGKK